MRNTNLAEIYRNKSCAVCHTDINVCGHHIKTYKSGGKDEDFNVIPLCMVHHNEIHTKGRTTFFSRYLEARNYIEEKGWILDKVFNCWYNENNI